MIFHLLEDKKSSWSVQANIADLDLSSPEAFGKSLLTNAGKVALNAFVAELTYKMGGRGILPSLLGMMPSLLMDYFDQTNTGQTNNSSLPDINQVGNIARQKDGKDLYDIPVLNYTPARKSIPAPAQEVDYKKLLDLDTDDVRRHRLPARHPAAGL